MIDPNLSEINKFGIQGSVSFSKTNPNTNMPLYRDILNFMRGDTGLGGSGGHLANRLQGPQGFQESHVFNSDATRRRVQQRLEQQFTEYLQQTVGPMAEQNNTSIPAFLQSQGIRGIREVGKGPNKRLSMYSPDNFISSSQNPITGSTEKMARAYMKQIGAVNQISGGTNESRRLSAYLRPNEAEYVNRMVNGAAGSVNAGIYNKGDMEALYGSTAQRSEIRTKQNAFKNSFSLDTLKEANPIVMNEIKSKILKQSAQKELYAQAKQELVASGELPGNHEEERKQSPASAAAKGAVAVLSKIAGTLADIKGMFTSALGYLQNLASLVGGLIKNSAPLGLTYREASKVQAYGRQNTVFTGGNENVGFDSLKAIVNGAADIRRAGGLKYDGVAMHGYEDLIPMILKESQSKTPHPENIARKLYGNLAQRVFNINTAGKSDEEIEKVRQSEIARQLAFVEEMMPGSTGLYSAMIEKAITKGSGSRVNKSNAYNIYDLEMNSSSSTEKHNPTGAAINGMFGLAAGNSYGTREDAGTLNAILGVLKQIEDAIGKLVLANMDKIARLLMTISEGILSIAAYFENNPNGPMHQMLKATSNADKELGAKGNQEAVTSAAKLRATARNILMEKGLTRATAEDAVSKYTTPEAMEKYIPQAFEGKKGRTLLIALEALKEVEKDIEYYENDPDKKMVSNGLLKTYLGSGNQQRNTYLKERGHGIVTDTDYLSIMGTKVDNKDIKDESTFKTVPKKYIEHVDGFIKSIEEVPEHKELLKGLKSSMNNLDILNRMPFVASEGFGSLLPSRTQEKQSVELDHNVNLTLNGKEVFSSKETLDTSVRRRHVKSSNVTV